MVKIDSTLQWVAVSIISYVFMSFVFYFLIYFKLKNMFLFKIKLPNLLTHFDKDTAVLTQDINQLHFLLDCLTLTDVLSFGIFQYLKILKQHNKIIQQYKNRPEFKLYIRNKNLKKLI